MSTYWSGNKKVSKSQYDATQAKNAAWSGTKVVDTPTTTRQPSGKQPDPYTGGLVVHGHAKTGNSPIIPDDIRKKIDEYNISSGKQPDTSALNAIDQDTLRRLQEEADRKRIEEQFEAAATHGKEYVFEFSKPVTSKANTYISRLVKLLGGKRSYIEDQTKLVVVM